MKNTNEKDIVIYVDKNDNINVDVMLINGDLWLTQTLIASLFGVSRSTITEHINNIFSSGELNENTSVGISDESSGGRKPKLYNLDVIIAVGYRVNSKKATQFRIWATNILKEYMKKGFALNDKRFIEGNNFDSKYFDELLERIKVIRVSEKMAYRKITQLFSETSIDYNPKSEEAYEFFKIVQNKLHYAISGKTAAELIFERANSDLVNMGLTTWKNSPDGLIYKYDVTVAKNYLNQEEIKKLNDLTNLFLVFAEEEAKDRNIMKMSDWIKTTNDLLKLRKKKILDNAGAISKNKADTKAIEEYVKYQERQDMEHLTTMDNFYNKYLTEQINKGDLNE